MAVGVKNLPDLAARVDALHQVRERPDFLAVVLAAKRIANIITDHEEYPLEAEALVEPAEKDLHRAYGELRGGIDEAAVAGDYAGGLEKIAAFAEVLDRFFVEVLVMDEDRRLRRNRIALLQAIHRTLSRVARLTEVVVDKGGVPLAGARLASSFVPLRVPGIQGSHERSGTAQRREIEWPTNWCTPSAAAAPKGEVIRRRCSAAKAPDWRR